MATNQVYADPKFDGYYNTILANLQTSAPQVEYAMPSQDQLATQIAAYLRPQYDRAIASRQQQTLQNRAATDVDAASRGMGSSTWVTDVKNQAAKAESSDIANLESSYSAQLMESLLNQYNQMTANKLNVDTANAQLRAQYEQMAYDRAADMYNLTQKKSGSGSGSKKTATSPTDLEAQAVISRYADYLSGSGAVSKNKSVGERRSDVISAIKGGTLESKYPGINDALSVLVTNSYKK